MTHKRYMDIEHIREGNCLGFNIGDHIIIQEKIDGANAAVRYDSETDTIVAQSRNNMLDSENDLRGFWEWTQTLDKELIKSVLGENLIAFCEWLVPHTVKYPEDKYSHAYFYDVFDREKGKYLDQSAAKEIIGKLGFTYVPVFYEGEFVSWTHCKDFVGKTAMGGEYGEGVVVKNQTRLNDPNTRLPFYIKIVGSEFAETAGHRRVKEFDPNKVKAVNENKALAETIVTEARVTKLLNKLVDEGILPENWGLSEMPIIAKNLTKAVYEDCRKEEPETVDKIENFGRESNRIALKIVKSIIMKKIM